MSFNDSSLVWGTETPFRISAPQEKLDKLQRKLQLDQRAPLHDIQRLMNHWKTVFDRHAEKKRPDESFRGNSEVENSGSLNIHYVQMQDRWRYPTSLPPRLRAVYLSSTAWGSRLVNIFMDLLLAS
ncbi:hypothetical protein CYLTODRAFT_450942 [Cylindrobasidium torrendii FP15055 ss-10]|uniref:Epoxide hydrolase N-terminal domain-containing protein n=1 Tax=Cylindrobasidium torrendii FP15055 ss-10 TaxID=1314674 RepID=A0A0D7BM69_9AGAR|nr:hypothetical protein CYLTODRAFT_450942 [Cylindrobasidium torrendii FP15055 ss-10]